MSKIVRRRPKTKKNAAPAIKDAAEKRADAIRRTVRNGDYPLTSDAQRMVDRIRGVCDEDEYLLRSIAEVNRDAQRYRKEYSSYLTHRYIGVFSTLDGREMTVDDIVRMLLRDFDRGDLVASDAHFLLTSMMSFLSGGKLQSASLKKETFETKRDVKLADKAESMIDEARRTQALRDEEIASRAKACGRKQGYAEGIDAGRRKGVEEGIQQARGKFLFLGAVIGASVTLCASIIAGQAM